MPPEKQKYLSNKLNLKKINIKFDFKGSRLISEKFVFLDERYSFNFVEKFRSNYFNSSKWFYGKSSLGLEWIIPFLKQKGHIVDYINPNLVKINDIHKRSEYIINHINKLKK